MPLLTDVDASAHPQDPTVLLKLWLEPSGERDYVLSPTQAEVLILALTDALAIVDERAQP
jgi:hypothetical protein